MELRIFRRSRQLRSAARVAISLFAVSAATVAGLAGCAAEPEAAGGQEAAGTTETPAPESTGEASDAAPEVTAAAVTQEESCGWGESKLGAGVPGALPVGPGDDISTAIIGAWQHTHFDAGAGFEAVGEGTDIRFVFPSTSRLLYCQDVAGATAQAENAVDFVLADTAIQLPGTAPGYVVTAWNADTMLWKNNLDGSTFLLQRR